MKVKTISLTVAVFCISATLFGQTKYIQTSDGSVDTVTYFKMKNEQIEKFKAFSSKVVIKDNFKEIRRSNDSVIYSYKWDIKIGEVQGAITEDNKNFDPDQYIDKEFLIPQLMTLNNKTIDLNDLKGKPTLINFWFTTCKPCIEEMPILNKIKTTFKDSVNFVAITFETTTKVRQFLTKHKFNFQQIPNAEKFIDALNMTSFPVNVFLDKSGKVVRIENGIPYTLDKNKKLIEGDGKDFENTLRKLL